LLLFDYTKLGSFEIPVKLNYRRSINTNPPSLLTTDSRWLIQTRFINQQTGLTTSRSLDSSF
jgi:hypothetical protein